MQRNWDPRDTIAQLRRLRADRRALKAEQEAVNRALVALSRQMLDSLQRAVGEPLELPAARPEAAAAQQPHASLSDVLAELQAIRALLEDRQRADGMPIAPDAGATPLCR